MTTVRTTDGVPASEREAFWRHALSGLLPVTITILGEGSVEGSVRLNRAGRMVIVEGKATSQDVRRIPRDISPSQPEYFHIAVAASGICRVSQDDRQAELHTGDWAAYESFRPVQLLFDSDWHACTFTFPRETVQLGESERRLMTARRMDGSTGMTGVVSRFLLDLARTSGQVPAGQRERVLLQASDLVTILLSDYSDPTEAVRGCVQRTLMLRIKDYIGRRFTDPALGPSEIAAAVNISTRYLHKLFEAEHQSVSQYIKGLRLERSRRDLVDPRLAGRSVAAVAFACGFGDLSGFNRAFKDAYGITPRELRMAVAAREGRQAPPAPGSLSVLCAGGVAATTMIGPDPESTSRRLLKAGPRGAPSFERAWESPSSRPRA
ncbi:MAG TPA: helix-turn-helix domain-containing protein [Streptosporangiaceae bacterium]